VLVTPWLFAQEAGGWMWLSYPEAMMRVYLGVAPALALYYGAGALLLWALPGRGRRIKFAVMWVAAHAYLVGVAEIGTFNFVSSMIPVVVMLGWFLWRRQRAGDDDPLGEAGALVVLVGISTSLWWLLRGYTVANADWGFAYTYLGWVRHDAVFFGLALVLCIPKYGLGMMTGLIYICLHSTPRQVERLFDRLLLLLMFKMSFYYTQLLFGSIRPGEKLHELAVGGIIYFSLFFPMLGTVYLVFWISNRIKQRRGTA